MDKARREGCVCVCVCVCGGGGGGVESDAGQGLHSIALSGVGSLS